VLQLKVVRRQTSEANDDCPLEFMIDGERLKTKTHTARDGYMLSQRVLVGADVMRQLREAEKIAFRACDQRWALMRWQVQLMHDYMDRFEQEREWKAVPKREAGMLEPSSGWPIWVVGGTPPGNVQATPLDGASLYKLLKVSIFQLEATRKDGVSQGSAVAVSPTELLTNCHVVQGSRSLVVRQDHVQWNGRIDRADPKTDRCIVVVPNGSFTPIAGVRPYESLEVGESVYTLGSPIGLELTLANGILSGRREEGGRRYVQTTAPISPGSSGGGLFDARGNLIGITTLAIVGKERLNQALNFAIPADAFWK
jgi:S1-C subfamily serine protease